MLGMTPSLHLPARPGVPIACDMSTATDTMDERLRDYQRLFEQALLRRERRADAVTFTFNAAPGTREQVEDLVRREAACCPFFDFHVETAGDVVNWTTTNPVAGQDRAAVDVILDAIHDLPDHSSSDVAGLFDRLAERGVPVLEGPGGMLRR